jgi:iron complex outermembrane receptor protein
MLWTATSYAIRAPTPFDRDVVEKIGPTVFLTGASNFPPEKLSAYEFGGRFEPISRLSVSVSAYYNVYDALRSIEPKPGGFLPLTWGNGMRGRVWGVESWANFQAASWWRLSASINVMREVFTFKPGASGLLGPVQAADDPQHLASMKSSMNLGRDVTLDADLRYVDALPNPSVPAYVELGGRIAWNITDKVQLSLVGQNLLHDRHQEYPAPGASASPRQVYAGLRLKF